MKFEPLKERDSPPDYKVIVKSTEMKTSLCVGMSLVEYRHFLRKLLLREGFDLKKKINRYEDLDKLVIVYEQKKYIIPKRKKHEKIKIYKS